MFILYLSFVVSDLSEKIGSMAIFFERAKIHFSLRKWSTKNDAFY